MKKNSIKNYLLTLGGLFIALFILPLTSCNDDNTKLTADDRVTIDTITAKAISKLGLEMDKQCHDNADALRKQLVDSLVVIREREIMTQTLPVH